MRHIMQYVIKKDSFALPFPVSTFGKTVQQVGCSSEGFPWAPQPSSSHYWSLMGMKEEERKQNGRMHFKERCSGHSGKEGG